MTSLGLALFAAIAITKTEFSIDGGRNWSLDPPVITTASPRFLVRVSYAGSDYRALSNGGWITNRVKADRVFASSLADGCAARTEPEPQSWRYLSKPPRPITYVVDLGAGTNGLGKAVAAWEPGVYRFQIFLNYWLDEKTFATVKDRRIMTEGTFMVTLSTVVDRHEDGEVTGGMRLSVFEAHVARMAKERHVPIDEAVRAVRAWGIEGADLWYAEDHLASNAAMLAGGLNPATLVVFMDFAHTNDTARAEAAIAYAKRVCSPRIMLVPGFHRKNERRDDAWREMKPNLADFLARAGRAGLEVDLEDFDAANVVVGSRGHLRDAFRAFPSLGHVLDTGNYLFWKDDVLAAQREFASRIRHVHVKDRDANDSSRSVAVGTGVIPVRDVVRELASTGYCGYLTVECFGSTNLWDDVRRSTMTLKEILK